MARLMQRRQAIRQPDFNASGNWQDRGFESKGAAQSVGKGLGLMKQPGGGWGKPTMDQFTGVLEKWGYGPKAQAGATGSTPVAIGGARWMTGPEGPQFTGQQSDRAGGQPYTASKQTPYGAGKLRPRTGDAPNLGNIPGMAMPHTQIGQQGRGTGERKGNLGRPAGPGKAGGTFMPKSKGNGKPGGGVGKPGAGPGASIAKPGAFPAAPPEVPNYLPMTPGYEAAYRGANDQLASAEGSYAASGALLPAQIAQQRARLQTDQGVATDRLKEQLAERGIYTPYGAGSTAREPQMASSPAGGGVGEALYNRQVATPFGRSRQDLGSSAAEAYQGRALDYGGAQLGFNQQMFDALLQRAGDAYDAMPLSLPIGGYELPEMAGPMFSAPPGGGTGKPGTNRNRNGNRNRGRKNRGSRRK